MDTKEDVEGQLTCMTVVVGVQVSFWREGVNAPLVPSSHPLPTPCISQTVHMCSE